MISKVNTVALIAAIIAHSTILKFKNIPKIKQKIHSVIIKNVIFVGKENDYGWLK